MKKTITLFTVALLHIAGISPAAEGNAESEKTSALSKLSWLLGNWEAEAGKTREDWSHAGGDTFEGVGYSVSPGGTKRVNEALRIVEMGGAIFYLAKVRQNPLPVAFKMVRSSKNEAVFENRKHDFPQKITYKRDGDTLTAVVEGARPGSGFTVELTRVERDDRE